MNHEMLAKEPIPIKPISGRRLPLNSNDIVGDQQLTEEQYRELLENQWEKDQIYRRNPRMCPVFCGHF